MSAVYAIIMWSWVMAGPGDASYVDVIGAEVPNAMELYEKYPDNALIPADEKGLPDAVRKIDRWTVITSKGASERKVTGISIRSGAGENHVLYWLDGPKVEQGLAVAKPLPKAGPLRKVKARAPSKAVSKALMKEVVAEVPEDNRGDIKKKKPGRKDIELVTMKTPAKDPITLAFVHIPQGEMFEGYLSAVAVIAKDGSVTAWIVKPSMNINKQEPQFLVDPEGDGTDALVVDDSYYEGWYRGLLTFDAKGEPQIQPLTGDGA